VAELRGWDVLASPPTKEALADLDAVVHLAGEPIDAGRWSDEQKKRIRDSRIVSTRHLVNGFRSLDEKPAAFISGSAVGFYGDRGDEVLEETAPPGSGFMSDVCVEWEAEAARAKEIGMRVVQVRTGVVLSREGGALKKMLTPFKLGVAGRLGSGRQWFPWIHIDDIVGIFREAILSTGLAGPVNGVAPNPVTNSEFTRQLAGALSRPAFLPVPSIGLKVLMGEMSEVLLGSQRVIPRVMIDRGFEYRFPNLGEALNDLLA
jgi:uncharacterized protein (TIGR01777 family)